MRIFFLLCFLPFVFSLTAQTSAQYEKLKKELKPIAVYDTIGHYKSGALKFKGSMVEYDTRDYVYYRNIGRLESFYRKGSLMRTSIFDSSGLLLSEKFYDPAGGLFCEYELIDFDTTASTATEFLESNSHALFTAKEKNYKYSIKHCITYLHSEGLIKNGKRSGTWKFFDVHGVLKKEKKY